MAKHTVTRVITEEVESASVPTLPLPINPATLFTEFTVNKMVTPFMDPEQYEVGWSFSLPPGKGVDSWVWRNGAWQWDGDYDNRKGVATASYLWRSYPYSRYSAYLPIFTYKQ